MRTIRCRPRPLACCMIVLASLSSPAWADDTRKQRSKPADRVHSQPVRTEGSSGGFPADSQHGNASFYSKHLDGRRTASGQSYDPQALTAAHRTLPLGTQVLVVNPKNDKSVVVTVNDRGPIPKNRMIDVSSAAADELDMKKAGVTKVETQVIGR